MNLEVIDFHTHPFVTGNERIGAYVDCVNMTTSDFFDHMKKSGVGVCVGSVIGTTIKCFDDVSCLNRHALLLREKYKNAYVPGFHVHPYYVWESVSEIDYALQNGVNIIGELVPYHHGWDDYSAKGFMDILSHADGKKMIVSVHIGSVEDLHRIEKSVSEFKNTIFVLAHPGYGERFKMHLEMLKKYENTYIDLSGSGIELWGATKKIVDTVGYDRLLFGTDFPVTAVPTYVSAVLCENISDTAKEHILSKNAKRLLNI